MPGGFGPPSVVLRGFVFPLFHSGLLAAVDFIDRSSVPEESVGRSGYALDLEKRLFLNSTTQVTFGICGANTRRGSNVKFWRFCVI